jgi:hypothetical protein
MLMATFKIMCNQKYCHSKLKRYEDNDEMNFNEWELLHICWLQNTTY